MEAFDESGRRTVLDRTRSRKIKIGGGYAAAAGAGLSASTALLWRERDRATDQRLWTVAAAADYVLWPQRRWSPALGTEGTCTGELTDTGVDTDCSLEASARIELSAMGGKGVIGRLSAHHVRAASSFGRAGTTTVRLRVGYVW